MRRRLLRILLDLQGHRLFLWDRDNLKEGITTMHHLQVLLGQGSVKHRQFKTKRTFLWRWAKHILGLILIRLLAKQGVYPWLRWSGKSLSSLKGVPQWQYYHLLASSCPCSMKREQHLDLIMPICLEDQSQHLDQFQQHPFLAMGQLMQPQMEQSWGELILAAAASSQALLQCQACGTKWWHRSRSWEWRWEVQRTQAGCVSASRKDLWFHLVVGWNPMCPLVWTSSTPLCVSRWWWGEQEMQCGCSIPREDNQLFSSVVLEAKDTVNVWTFKRICKECGMHLIVGDNNAHVWEWALLIRKPC